MLKRSAIKRKPRKAVPKAEREHMGWVASKGCLVCKQPATVHHVSSDGMKRVTRSSWLTVPLCPRHHLIQHGPHESVEALGHGGFTKMHDIDLLKMAKRLTDLSPFVSR